MKWLLSTFLLIGLASASIFRIQDEADYEGDSTKLITTCGDSSDLLSIDYINLNPDPPVKGKTLKIDFKGYLKDEVPEGSTVDVKVKYGVVQLVHKVFDLCNEIKKINETCPIPAGVLELSKEVDLPKEIPGGLYTVHAEIFTPEEERVACLIGKTRFPRF